MTEQGLTDATIKRLTAAASSLAGRRCTCACRCGILHVNSGPCALCLAGDHWFSLDDYLRKIGARNA
jgi:hypothetical protein